MRVLVLLLALVASPALAGCDDAIISVGFPDVTGPVSAYQPVTLRITVTYLAASSEPPLWLHRVRYDGIGAFVTRGAIHSDCGDWGVDSQNEELVFEGYIYGLWKLIQPGGSCSIGLPMFVAPGRGDPALQHVHVEGNDLMTFVDGQECGELDAFAQLTRCQRGLCRKYPRWRPPPD